MEKENGIRYWQICLLAIFALLLIFVAFTYLSVSTTDDQSLTYVVLDLSDLDSSTLRSHDSILIVTNRFYQGEDLKRLMQGEQYRDAWSTPVKLPIVWLDTLFGGMTVLEKGGGMQTHSLKLTSANGVKFTLRQFSGTRQLLYDQWEKVSIAVDRMKREEQIRD